jgi:hypothetical protein
MLTLPVYDLVPSCGASARVSSYTDNHKKLLNNRRDENENDDIALMCRVDARGE